MDGFKPPSEDKTAQLAALESEKAGYAARAAVAKQNGDTDLADLMAGRIKQVDASVSALTGKSRHAATEKATA